jgi:predicted transcriptional regulator
MVKSEERLIPVIRAVLAERMSKEGLRVKEIAITLNVTQAAVTQYLKRRRGGGRDDVVGLAQIIEPLAEKAVKKARSGLGPIETVELLETARQLAVMTAGRGIVENKAKGSERNQSLELLRERLQLELSAAERYLELANRATDDHTKLLLRMIASDSIKHGDVVSQVISWLEAESKKQYELPGKQLLESMLAMEDSAKEVGLYDSVKVDHPVARLLLEWIDMDEAKHGKMVTKMLAMDKNRDGARSRSSRSKQSKPL